MGPTEQPAGPIPAAGTENSRAEEVSLVRDLMRESLLHAGRKRGYRLPYEHELSRELGCSRNVLREALRLLVDDGVLHRERGRGTYVLSASPAISIERGLDLADAMRAEITQLEAADAVRYPVLRVDMVRASAMLAGLFEVAEGTSLRHVERLVEFDGQRVGHWNFYIRHVTGSPVGPPLAELARTKLTGQLLRGLGICPHHEEVRVEAITPSPHTAMLLYQGERSRPTLRVTRKFYDAGQGMLAMTIGRCAWPAATFSMIRKCALDQ